VKRAAGGPRAWAVFVVEDGVARRKGGAEQTGTCRGDRERTAESHNWGLLLPTLARSGSGELDEWKDCRFPGSTLYKPCARSGEPQMGPSEKPGYRRRSSICLVADCRARPSSGAAAARHGDLTGPDHLDQAEGPDHLLEGLDLVVGTGDLDGHATP
jgi:hypothetical protein